MIAHTLRDPHNDEPAPARHNFPPDLVESWAELTYTSPNDDHGRTRQLGVAAAVAVLRRLEFERAREDNPFCSPSRRCDKCKSAGEENP